MQPDKADQVPDRLIQKRRMIIRHLARRVDKSHLEKRVCHAAVRLAVHEVAPATENLPDNHAHCGVIEHNQRRNPFYPAQNQNRDRTADDAAVDRKSALPDVEHRDGVVSVEVPVEHAVVKPRAHNADGHRPQHQIQHVVLRNAERFCAVQHIQNRQQEAARNNNAVPVDILPHHREGDGARVHGDAEIWKRNWRRQQHDFSSFSRFGRMTDTNASSSLTFSRMNCSTSSAVTPA